MAAPLPKPPTDAEFYEQFESAQIISENARSFGFLSLIGAGSFLLYGNLARVAWSSISESNIEFSSTTNTLIGVAGAVGGLLVARELNNLQDSADIYDYQA